MLDNIKLRADLTSDYRLRSRPYVVRSIPTLLVPEEEAKGWIQKQANKTTVVMRKDKPHSTWLEDRLWSLLYRMQFSHLSGKGGQRIVLDPKNPDSTDNQIDVMAVDNEITLAFECKSQAKVGKLTTFQEDLAKFAKHRERISQDVRARFGNDGKRPVILVMLLNNVALSDEDRQRAEMDKVILLEEQDLLYYEQLVSHVGEAAKYQMFASLIPNRTVPQLEIKLPAIKSRLGKTNCYTFSITPEALLKIAFVSHRMRGKATDVDTYQRMINKGRLKKIGDYISKGGVFPTNIVVNLSKTPQFDQSIKEENPDKTYGVLGIATLKPNYGSAWVIDGQHRLYAYSGHPRASKDVLSVLAFDNLPADEQAKMFTDINAEQKSVPQSLLRELYAELNWNAPDDMVKATAISSKAVQQLGADMGSPFYRRIKKADVTKDAMTCISFGSLCQALEKSKMHIAHRAKGGTEYGPLWANDSDSTVKRTVFILKRWFQAIRELNEGWWDLGSAPGGGIAMGDGVTVCVMVLDSVLQFLQGKGEKLRFVSDKALFDKIEDHAIALATYLESLDIDQRKHFRELRGSQGHVRAKHECQRGMQLQLHDFAPQGLDKFMELDSAQTSQQAAAIVQEIEHKLHKTIVEELKDQSGTDKKDWWQQVPMTIRVEAAKRYEQDNRQRGSEEEYLELGDYRPIIEDNWGTFESLFAYGKGNKRKRLQWILEVIDIKKMVANGAAKTPLSVERLSTLQQYQNWIYSQLNEAGYAVEQVGAEEVE